MLTGNEFRAQAHKVVAPPDPSIGRLSVINFIGPALAQEMGPLDTDKKP